MTTDEAEKRSPEARLREEAARAIVAVVRPPPEAVRGAASLLDLPGFESLASLARLLRWNDAGDAAPDQTGPVQTASAGIAEVVA